MSWMPEVEELFEYYTEVRISGDLSGTEINDLIADNWKLYRAQEELHHLALPSH